MGGGCWRGNEFESQALKRFDLLLDRNLYAEQLSDFFVSQLNRRWLDGVRVGIDRAGHELATGSLENQLRGPAAGPIGNVDVRAALEAIGSVGAQVELFGGGADVLRFEVRALDQHIGG